MSGGTNKSSGTTDRPALPLPPVGEPVWVKCQGFRVLAYLDSQGKWRTFADNKEIVGVVSWITSDKSR